MEMQQLAPSVVLLSIHTSLQVLKSLHWVEKHMQFKIILLTIYQEISTQTHW